MTRKPPAMQFYVSDWLGDPAVGACSPATRGIWIDWLCGMWRRQTGYLEGTVLALSRVGRCSGEEAIFALKELVANDAADVTFPLHVTNCNIDVTSNVTVVNRRMKRDLTARESTKERVAEFRKRKCNADVTPNVTPRSSSSASCTATTTLQTNSSKPSVPAIEKMDKPDPLETLPILKEWFPRLIQMFNLVFIREPMNDQQSHNKARIELDHIARLDKFSEREIIETLTWWLESQDPEADFWRVNCRTVHSLRKKKNDGTKFAQMFAKSKQGPRHDAGEFRPPIVTQTPAGLGDDKLPF